MRYRYSPNVGPSSPNRKSRVSQEKCDFATHLRKNMTESETLLWERLRGNKLGVRFRRQAIVLGYIADFWCPTFRLVVELDGACHAERVAYDAERDRNLAKHGIHTLRIPSRQVFSDMAGVIRRIKQSFDQAD